MNRLDRLFAITTHLQGRPAVRAEDLARHFEVSKRTIYRDLDLLSALGVPVYAERGRSGGIRLMPDYFLPPVTFSPGEAVSLVRGEGVEGGDRVLARLRRVAERVGQQRPQLGVPRPGVVGRDRLEGAMRRMRGRGGSHDWFTSPHRVVERYQHAPLGSAGEGVT